VDPRIRTLEIHGAAAGLDADDLAAALRAEPIVALRELHGRLTRGLVAPERAGRIRVSEQAVHDASTGRILYFTTDPRRVGADLEALCGWLATTDDHAAIVAGTAHLELLRIHPFDAANGRLARAVSLLLLRDGGLDPRGLAVTDAQLADDPIGYHEQVAGALRSRDLDRWLEYFAESVEAGLLDAARTLPVAFEPPLDRAAGFLDALAEPAFTLADYRDTVRVDVDAARDDLDRLLEAGEIRRVRGSAGLRFERRAP
jgi:Fic family protein